MEARTKLQVERAARVIGFSREHPSEVPGYQAAVLKLDERLTRTRKMADQQIGSGLQGKGALADRAILARQIVADLQLLAGIARAAGVESAGTPKRIRYPGPRRNQVLFLSGARVAVAETEGELERLIAFGLPAEHLTTLRSRLDQFGEYLAKRDETARARIEARAEMRSLSREMRILVEQLDALNRHRFLGDTAMLAVWRSTRRLRAPVPVAKSNGEPAQLRGSTEAMMLPPGQPAQ